MDYTPSSWHRCWCVWRYCAREEPTNCPSRTIDRASPAMASALPWRRRSCFAEFMDGWNWTCREKDKSQAGAVLPVFYSLAGEEVTIPRRFHAAVRAITKAVNCVGCSHRHFSRAPKGEIRIGLSSVGEVGVKGVETTCKEG